MQHPCHPPGHLSLAGCLQEVLLSPACGGFTDSLGWVWCSDGFGLHLPPDIETLGCGTVPHLPEDIIQVEGCYGCLSVSGMCQNGGPKVGEIPKIRRSEKAVFSQLVP